MCDGPQGREDSFGRRRRRRRSVLEEEEEEETMDEQNVRVKRRGGRGMEEDFNVREMFRASFISHSFFYSLSSGDKNV